MTATFQKHWLYLSSQPRFPSLCGSRSSPHTVFILMSQSKPSQPVHLLATSHACRGPTLVIHHKIPPKKPVLDLQQVMQLVSHATITCSNQRPLAEAIASTRNTRWNDRNHSQQMHASKRYQSLTCLPHRSKGSSHAQLNLVKYLINSFPLKAQIATKAATHKLTQTTVASDRIESNKTHLNKIQSKNATKHPHRPISTEWPQGCQIGGAVPVPRRIR